MKLEDLVYVKHNFNRYETKITFVSNFLTEGSDTDDEMYKYFKWLIIKSMN